MTPAAILRARGRLGPYPPAGGIPVADTTSTPWTAADVRAWAAEQGIKVKASGPLPSGVITAYLDAHPEIT